jgi:nucleotide-binding universal stress UspA family protein
VINHGGVVATAGRIIMPEKLFRKILHAYDGSESATDAFTLALKIAEQTGGELHIVSVGEIDHIPLFLGDVREQNDNAAQRLRSFLFRAEPLAADAA